MLLSTERPDLWKPHSLGIVSVEFTGAGNFSLASFSYSTFISTSLGKLGAKGKITLLKLGKKAIFI